MKRALFLFLMIIISPFYSVLCQTTPAKSDSIWFKGDSILNLIVSKLPAGWGVKNDSNKLVFTRKDSIWKLDENRGNMKGLSKEQIHQRIKENGTKTNCYIIFSFEPKWTLDDMLMASYNNTLYGEEINKLSEKYSISQYEDKENSTRFHKVYKAKDAKEQKIINAYNKEKKSLTSQLKKIPDYHTSKFSIFLNEMHGYNDNEILIFPDEASQELFKVKNLFDEICMNPKFK